MRPKKGSAASGLTLNKQSVVGKTYQPPALPTKAGVFKPRPHVFVRVDDQRSNHQDSLPVLYDALTALKQDKRDGKAPIRNSDNETKY